MGRKKKDKIDKKLKINISINDKLDAILDEYIITNKTKKSRVIENLIKEYLKNKQ